MSKKHYIAFAKEIKKFTDINLKDEYGVPVTAHLAALIAKIAHQESPRFDKERFMKACGLYQA